MEENNSNSKRQSVTPEVIILKLGAGLAIAFLIFFLAVYSIVLGLSAAAIYFGVKIGSNGQIGKKPRHQKVKDIQEKKQVHLEELGGESEDLRELVDKSFENEKMDLYRPDEDALGPIFSINTDAVKTVVKRVVKKVAEKPR